MSPSAVRPWPGRNTGEVGTPPVGLKPPFRRRGGIRGKFGYLLLQQADARRTCVVVFLALERGHGDPVACRVPRSRLNGVIALRRIMN